MRARERDAAEGIVRLTVMADYGGSPIWRAHGEVRVWPEELGLTAPLCDRIRRWGLAYERELADVDYDEWAREGPRLAAAIAEELGGGAVVDFQP